MKSLKNCTVTINVSNLEKAIQFYVDILGLEIQKRYGEYYAEIIGPGLLIGLHPTNSDFITSSNISVGFGVKKFDEEVKFLKSGNIELKLTQDGPIRIASFKDPDGNSLYLAEI